MSDRNRKKIVVGVDGSQSSIEALRWALRQAEATGTRVSAVQAWQVPYVYGWDASTVPGEQIASASKDRLQEAVLKVTDGRPAVPLESRTVAGHPARVLIEQSAEADLLVVGSRGHGGFVGALLGSVSQYCIQHANCPVVVIRGKE